MLQPELISTGVLVMRYSFAALALSLLLILILIPSESDAKEILYARYPALSPDGNTVAFTYHGDIWLAPAGGGKGQRLTVHEADDIRPQFSPDGKWILFSSSRFNNYDVFIIPVDGGQSRQLTFHSDYDVGTGWFPNSDSILFTSNRESWADIFKVSIDGGMPIKLTGYSYEREYNGRISPDGRYLIFNNGSGLRNWWRRDLRTKRNTDVYMQDRSKDKFTSVRLTNFKDHDIWPVLNPAANEIYFVSCRGDWGQIWKVPADGGQAVQITDFTDDGVQWLNSNPQGTMLVFEQGMQLWKMDPADGVPRKIIIDIDTDERENLTAVKTFKGDIEWFSLSPDEMKIAVVIHGEIYVIPSEKPKEGIRITETDSRERYPVWGKDSKVIYYASDRNGNYDIFSADAISGKEKQLTDSEENETKPIVSPNGKYLAYYRGMREIIRRDLSSGKETVWATGVFYDLAVESTIEYDWSPDSKWLVFNMAGPTYDTDIHLVDIDGKVSNISKFAGWNHRPRFSNNGKIVYFSSGYGEDKQTYKIDLLHKPVEFFESSFDSLFMKKKDGEKEKEEDKESEEVRDIKVDLRNIELRRTEAYRLTGSSSYPVLTPDSEKYVFVASILGKPEIWAVNTEGDPDLTQLTHTGKGKSNLLITSDSKTVYFLEDGKIKKCGLSNQKTETLSFEAVLQTDVRKNNEQKLNETWQMLKNYFYDPDFHGIDWHTARKKYAPALEHVRTDREFRNLVFEMMGELKASHLYIYSQTANPSDNILTGELGIELDYNALEDDGHFRIKKIIDESPAYMEGLKEGQYIISLNGKELTPEFNFNKLLAGERDHRMSLQVSDNPNRKGKEVLLKPISGGALYNLAYEDWVRGRREVVDSLSNGRLAYLHIRGMSHTYLKRFEQELVSIAEKKEAMIIDVRNNGGGNVAVHLLGILVKSPYILRNFRSFPVTSENKLRSKSYEKPMILLINNYSGSNSEIFTEGFRKLKLGKVVGEPTAGGVIGTSSYTLIDGTRVRRPSWGAYTTEMEDTELYPREPDIFVENLPDDFINGRDPQLVRAVQELLRELE